MMAGKHGKHSQKAKQQANESAEQEKSQAQGQAQGQAQDQELDQETARGQESEPAAEAEPKPAAEPAPAPAPAKAYVPKQVVVPTVQKGHKGVWILLGILAAVMVVLIAGFFALTKGLVEVPEYIQTNILGQTELAVDEPEEEETTANGVPMNRGADDERLAGVQDRSAGYDVEYAAENPPAFKLTSKRVKKISAKGKKAVTFNMRSTSTHPAVDKSLPELSDDQKKGLKKAIKSIEDTGASVGFVFIDCQTGKGIAYNAEKRFYGASTIKGPYSVFYAEQYMDHGKKYGWKKKIASGKQNKLGLLTVTGKKSIKTLMKDAIVNSNDASYLAIHDNANRAKFAKWLKKLGLRKHIAYDTDYPSYSAKEGAMLWVKVRDYLKSDSKRAKQIKAWMGKTNKSPIRKGMIGYGGKVYNKAGWCTAKIAKSAVADNAWIRVDGRDYILSIMSNMDSSGNDKASKKVSKVVEALYECADALE